MFFLICLHISGRGLTLGVNHRKGMNTVGKVHMNKLSTELTCAFWELTILSLCSLQEGKGRKNNDALAKTVIFFLLHTNKCIFAFLSIIPQQKRMFKNTLGELWNDYEHSWDLPGTLWHSPDLENVVGGSIWIFFYMASLNVLIYKHRNFVTLPFLNDDKSVKKGENPKNFFFLPLKYFFFLQPFSNIIIFIQKALLVVFPFIFAK